MAFTETANSIEPTANDAINIVTSSGHEVAESGIICVLADMEAIATGIVDRYMATDRNNADRYTNYTSGTSVQYINDTSENGIIFTIGDYGTEG